MLTLQRSPRILCADVLDQVNFQKDPTLADLRSRYLAGSRFLLQRDRVNQEITVEQQPVEVLKRNALIDKFRRECLCKRPDE